MKTPMLLKLASGTLAAALLTFAFFMTVTFPSKATPPPIQARKTMKAFASEQELQRYLREWNEKQKRKALREAKPLAGMPPADAPPMATNGVFTRNDPVTKPEAESVTNTQHAGVDEGDIVKVHGDHLVILRRGRLFTVAIGDNQLRPVSAVDAFGPEIDPEQSWYDEMLVSGDTVVIIGYSYERGGTEVGLFNIDGQGQLGYRSTYHLRSNDYYSSRNYASRLIGNKLIFYSPTTVYPFNRDPVTSFPAVRKWHKGASVMEFQRMVPATRVYRTSPEYLDEYYLSLHTVTVCDLANGGFACQATSVIGPSGNVFYVSPDSVYVWASPWSEKAQRKSILFRMPLDGSAPTALRVSGSPVDQFSFLQSDDQYLNVLVRSEAKGDGMWKAEVAEGDVALLRIPLASFSDGTETVSLSSYRPLPKPQGYTFQNRFVGDYVIYGTGNGWGEPEDMKQQSQSTKLNDLFLVNWLDGTTHQLQLPHGVDRIEQMGADAVVVGTDGNDLHFTAIRLGPQQPAIASRYTREAASQGELRSHGFFYKPDGADSGTLGLPISTPARAGYRHLFENSAAILFLRNEDLQFHPIGDLGAQAQKAVDDKCRASCVDWYGNARPLFLRGRVFALLGYELVEGKLDNGRITEIRRVDYGMRSA